MRYEIEREGRHVASVVWEGPGQVAVRADDPAEAGRLDRFFGQEVAYLAGDAAFGGHPTESGTAERRRDWTPWEFERQVQSLARTLGATARRVVTGPVEEGALR